MEERTGHPDILGEYVDSNKKFEDLNKQDDNKNAFRAIRKVDPSSQG